MTEKIRACPFCGKDNLETKAIAHYGRDIWYVVECKVCYARGPIYSKGYLESDNGNAARLWNRRASDVPQSPVADEG
jgi:Lar family restriction alleviation protein